MTRMPLTPRAAIVRRSAMVLLVLIGAGCATQRSPLQVSVFPPVQLVSRTTEIDGLRLNLPCGENGTVRGLDLGIAGMATKRLDGIQLQLLGSEAGEVRGAQLALCPQAAFNYTERLMPILNVRF